MMKVSCFMFGLLVINEDTCHDVCSLTFLTHHQGHNTSLYHQTLVFSYTALVSCHNDWVIRLCNTLGLKTCKVIRKRCKSFMRKFCRERIFLAKKFSSLKTLEISNLPQFLPIYDLSNRLDNTD